MKRLVLSIILFLLLVQLSYSFQFSKTMGGKLNNSRTFSVHVNVPPEYDAIWLTLTFASNRTCNASLSYSIIQYQGTVERGNVSVKWVLTSKWGYIGKFVIPLDNLKGEFDVYANISFPCKVKPLDYTLYLSINLDRLRHLVVRTNRSIENAWILDIVKDTQPLIHFNTSGKLLGVRLRLYNYEGKKVYGIIKWEGGKRNFTVPVKKGWIWIPGENAKGKVDLMLNVPSNTGIEARAYYFSEIRPINEDLLYKKEGIIYFILPLKGITWDEGTIKVWFSGKGKILTFDFITGEDSRVYIDDNKACAELHIPGKWRKKNCVEIPGNGIHELRLLLSRSPDGRRYLNMLVDDVYIFEDLEVDSGIRLWYLGGDGNFSLISFDAGLKRNPDYYIVPSDERKKDIALGLSAVALIVSIVLNLRRLRR
ncbi:hypothetical protein [Thermococcus sp.]